MDNLHAILLMEGDFNGAMKILIVARMVHLALLSHSIPNECYGSQPGSMAIQVSLTWTLMVDIAQQSWATFVVVLVDCLTCYDSIGHPPASIACQCLNIAPSLLETIFMSIQQMAISLCTAHGNLSLAYSGTSSPGPPFQGVCQGNGAGPALWLATSIPLIEMV